MDPVSHLTLQQLQNISLEEFFQLVIEQNRQLTVQLPTGELIIIHPVAELAPLPALEGFIPDGWKNAIYAE